MVSRMALLGRDVAPDAEVYRLVRLQVARLAKDRLLSQRECCQIFGELYSL